MNREPSAIERLGNTFAFGLVLVILVVGCYLVYGIFRGELALISFGESEEVRPTVEIVMIQPTLTPLEGMEMAPEATATPLFVPPTPAPPTPSLEPQIEVNIPPTFTPAPDPTKIPTATPAPPTPTPSQTQTATPVPTETPIPTATRVPATPTPAYLFNVAAAGPDYNRGCEGHYIFGFVRAASGNPIPGLRVRAFNPSGLELGPATTKEDPAGWYDIPLTAEPSAWYVQVVDAGNNALSPQVEVQHTGNFVPGSEACWHQVDFVRAN